MLDSGQLKVAVDRAQERFGQITKKYPDLKAYLVFFLPLGQADIEAAERQILTDFPEMVVDGKAKNDALKIISDLKVAEKEEKTADIERLNRQLNVVASQFKYDDNVRVEIRFKDLKFKLVWALQADELVDRELTPQTKASIRIALGTIGTFTTQR